MKTLVKRMVVMSAALVLLYVCAVAQNEKVQKVEVQLITTQH